MAKFLGVVGYAETKETSPGVHIPFITERLAKGDVFKSKKNSESSGNVNDNINVNITISIIADEYANKNFFAIKYVVWKGSRWKVTSVDDSQRPRLVLTIGGLYNE